MTPYELEGTLKEIFETKTLGSKGFTKREFVVTVVRDAEDRYPQHIKLALVKDKCVLLDKFQRGQRVRVAFDLRGSEYQGRYFTDLQAWRIETVGSGAAAPGKDDFADEEPPGEDIPF